ncbi:hypothetical protein LOTGIDRAFT_163657 [Lottia gigantea]|uniref:DNA-directed DNA polymerase n=1 Tax=Lottia gigantea TaxID=225164 RepID=V4A6X9_LOTGI|nr:hypothetical protein LOTGIDRAFT_163657 [Lottia gigantea]ESO90775.1 hypothetical protein LOTGIDRAFT_163657 [Lottia gigantea]
MIVAHAPKTYFGSGDIQKSLGSLPGFPWAKYPREKHLPGHNYTGPGTSLAARGNSSNLPMNLRKIEDVDIAKYTKDNWEPLRHEWEPYAKRDTLCLGACLIKYNQAMKEVVFQNISNNLTAPSLSLKDKVLKEEEANRKSFETNKMDEICNILKEYTETASDNIIDLFKEYSASTKDKAEVHSRLKKIKCTKLMAFDANGLYASAMSDLDSEYPRAESGRPFRQEENKEFLKLFNEQKFRPRTAILKVWFEYHKNMFFQPIPAKDKITFTNRIGKKETGTKIRFRNGFCHDVLTSVDIQEKVTAGGRIIKILDGIDYEENFKTPPYRDYILILRDLRNKYKREGNIVGSNCMKLLGNSLYSIQKDITASRHLWSEVTLKANFDSHVIHYEKVNDSQYIVEINEEEKEFDCTPLKSTRLTPSHLGSFVLSHSKNIIDSLYISSSNWDKLNEGGLVSENDYCKGKND